MPSQKRPRTGMRLQRIAFVPVVPLQGAGSLGSRKCSWHHLKQTPLDVVSSRFHRIDRGNCSPKQYRRTLSCYAQVTSPASPKNENGSLEELEDHGTVLPPSLSRQSNGEEVEEEKRERPKRVVSEETRRKIAYAMLGQRRSEETRAKMSQKMKGRIPWNKGKKLSPETRARMSEARTGRVAWNKGRRLSDEHRIAISRSALSNGRVVSEDTRRKLILARRRPGDAIVGGRGGSGKVESGSYPLVDTADINEYITLRRELRVWSDKFLQRNSRRPSLADVRRMAPKTVMKKFEKYVNMRDQIRGLAADVYGAVNPAKVPVVGVGEAASSPSNNNARRVIHVTKHGNRRLIEAGVAEKEGGYREGNGGLEGAREDMWDMYDRPERGLKDTKSQSENSLFGAHELGEKNGKLSASDYRMIGKYRLMESIDIHRYVSLRKELERWSAAFKQRFGRTPTLSDARTRGKSMLYQRFCEYLRMRNRISGLVQEVYGTEMDDMETFQKVGQAGRVILDTLRAGASEDGHEHDIKSTEGTHVNCPE